MPRAHETPVFVDAAIGQISKEMTTAPSDGEKLAIHIADYVRARTFDGSGWEFGSGTDF
jgi:hypothetical protein